MRDARGTWVVLAAALCGALLAGAATAGLSIAGAFTPPQSVPLGPDIDESPLTWEQRKDLARPWSSEGPTAELAEQVEEHVLARRRITMLGHAYVVELVSSPYLELPDTAVYRAKEGGAFVDFRFQGDGRDPEAAEHALARAAHGDPLVTLVVESAGRTTHVDYRIGAIGDPRGANPRAQVIWPGPFSVPDVSGAEYWIEVDGTRLDVAP